MYHEDQDPISRRTKAVVLLSLLALLIALPTGLFLWMTSVPGRSFSGPTGNPTPAELGTEARLRRDVVAIASKPHNLSHPEAYLAARDYIRVELVSSGYKVTSQPVMPGADNLVVDVDGSDPKAPLVVIGAHYDSAGSAPGANDNGSGTAALLELARRLKPHNGRLRNRIRLIWFANEEPPYFQRQGMGSVVAAREIAGTGEPVLGMISLETIGYFDDRDNSQHYPFPLGLRYPKRANFVAFVGMTGSRRFVRRAVKSFREKARIPSVGGVAPEIVQGIAWSDHWSFEREGIPALMITDTAPFRYPWYHTAKDTPDKLDFRRLSLVVEGVNSMLLDLSASGL